MLSRIGGQGRSTWLAAGTVAVAAVAIALLADAVRQGPTPIDAFDAAILAMDLARVSAPAHLSTDVLGACLLALILGGWCLLAARGLVLNPSIAGRSIGRTGLLGAMPLALLLAGSSEAMAASPSPTAGTGGDPRSSGQGPGLIGDAGTAILGTLAIGIGSVVVTYAYVRLTPHRRRDDT